MTTASVPQKSPFAEVVVEPAAPRWWDRCEPWLIRVSEWLNPILVKEARQALKSRQFVVTFSLLLVCGWGWSLLGVALLSPGVSYAPGGRTMLTGYSLILLVPMIIIVPFSAFRSLAAEREDGTFELLSITTLNSRQIVTGKLGSAVLQMLVYYSALAPCIAFTYLLRGIDILTIVFLLLYVFMVSILLSSVGLLVATVSRSRHWQVVLSVGLVIGFVVADIIASWCAVGFVWSVGAVQYEYGWFWVLQLAILSFYVSFLALFIVAAAAQISFASDNRSTKLRIILLIQQLLWIYWMAYCWQNIEDNEFLFVIMPFAGAHAYLSGALMSGEASTLSPRVRRSLPQSFLGRMLGTWFNPGAGTGYVFAVLNLWTWALVTVTAAFSVEFTGSRGSSYLSETIWLATLTAAYVTAYLGVGRLITLVIRRHVVTGLILPLLIHILLAAAGAIVPAIIGGWIQGFRDLDYSLLQVTNWAWTMIESVDGDIWNEPAVPVTVFGFSGLIFLVNLVLARREIEQTRLLTPQRVLEDEQQLHPEKFEPPKRAHSPWDGQ